MGAPLVHEITSLKTRSLSDLVQDGIRAYIAENGLGPGDPLPSEAEFARQFEVSRNVVREGVKALQSTGLLVAQRGSGIFVGDFSFAPLLENLPYGLLTHTRPLTELLEVRELLEQGLIAEVALRHDDADLARMEQALDRMSEAAATGGNIRDADLAFHRALYSANPNSLVLELMEVFWVAFNEAASRVALPAPDLPEVVRLHRDIVDAVRAGDPEAAVSTMRAHYGGIEQQLARIVTPKG